MSCLAHDKRFRSTFHTIINLLRKEQQVPVHILHTLPRQCCTCSDKNENLTKNSEQIDDKDNSLLQLSQLSRKIVREAPENDRLIQSFDRFEFLIHKNRSTIKQKSPSPERKHRSRSRSSSSSSDSSMDLGLSRGGYRGRARVPLGRGRLRGRATITVGRGGSRKQPKEKSTKPPKQIRNGVFVFLPYHSNRSSSTSRRGVLMDVAQELQRKRFLGRKGHFTTFEKQHTARINMITPKTSQQIKDALEKAKTGMENLIIHKSKESLELAEKKNGEWILIRPKNSPNPKETPDLTDAIEQLVSQWETCLDIHKRYGDNSNSSRSKRIKKSFF